MYRPTFYFNIAPKLHATNASFSLAPCCKTLGAIYPWAAVPTSIVRGSDDWHSALGLSCKPLWLWRFLSYSRVSDLMIPYNMDVAGRLCGGNATPTGLLVRNKIKRMPQKVGNRSLLNQDFRPPPSCCFLIHNNDASCIKPLGFLLRSTFLVVYFYHCSSRAVQYHGVLPSRIKSACTKNDDFYLRIMPLGASITRGQPADPSDPNQNGYRKFIRDRLRLDGWKVNMVGSYSSWGNMADGVSPSLPRGSPRALASKAAD